MAKKERLTNEEGEIRKNKSEAVKKGGFSVSYKFGFQHNNPIYFPKKKKK